ncbi:MAG: response regulator [Anaerolineaceae bacterium]
MAKLKKQKKLVICDDKPCVRSALRLIIEQVADLEVTGEASDAARLREILRQSPPDLLLLDWELEGVHTAEFVTEIRRDGLAGKVIVMSSRLEANQESREVGVDGFICKSDPPEQVRMIIRKTLNS